MTTNRKVDVESQIMREIWNEFETGVIGRNADGGWWWTSHGCDHFHRNDADADERGCHEVGEPVIHGEFKVNEDGSVAYHTREAEWLNEEYKRSDGRGWSWREE
jgi:hypothetical protein